MMRWMMAALALAALAACGDNTSSGNGDSGVMRELERSAKAQEQQAQTAQTETQNFLEAARARPGVEAKPSGLLIEFTKHSSNASLPHPGAEDIVLVHYEGKLPNGTTFDSSLERGQPAQFPLNQVVPGFSEAIQLMRPGDEVIAYFPPDLGYGARGQPPVIPPNSALQFRIQLLAFRNARGRIVQAPRG